LKVYVHFFVGLTVLLNPINPLMLESATAQNLAKKKIVEFGSDVPTPDFVRDHIREMETRPLDGIIFHTKEYNHIFDTRPWTPEGFKSDMDALAAIRWQKFTDNFLTLYAADKGKVDWFDDRQWKVIEANMRLFSEAVATARCAGVCFDQEPYGDNPWLYKGRFPGKTFAEVAAQARKRGAQFMRAVQSAVPKMKMLDFFQLGYFGDTSLCHRTWRDGDRPNSLTEPDSAVRMQKLSERAWALYCPFFIGMLDAAGPEVVLIDGNELAYYYGTPYDFYYHYHELYRSSLILIPKELRSKYLNQTRAGNAVYYDLLMTDGYGQTRESPVHVPSHYMTPGERLQFLEQNVYYGLATADEYLWFYSESVNWWRDLVPAAAAYGPMQGIPADAVKAINSARTKCDQGQPLGFDFSEIIKRGWQAADKAYEEKLKKQE